jgi:hypothetical protein
MPSLDTFEKLPASYSRELAHHSTRILVVLGLDRPYKFWQSLSFENAWSSQMATIPPALNAICLMFLSENVDAFRRRVISSRRGCRHVPGLSVMEGSSTVRVFTGVVVAMIAWRCITALKRTAFRSCAYCFL